MPYVLVSDDDRIAGFYTLTSDNIRLDDLPPELVKTCKSESFCDVRIQAMKRRAINFLGSPTNP